MGPGFSESPLVTMTDTVKRQTEKGTERQTDRQTGQYTGTDKQTSKQIGREQISHLCSLIVPALVSEDQKESGRRQSRSNSTGVQPHQDVLLWKRPPHLG